MEIFIVTHHWNNGESYEDYQDYEERKHFSSYARAEQYYNDKITNKYFGNFAIIKTELDNPDKQEEVLIKSEYHECLPLWSLDDEEYDRELAEQQEREAEWEKWIEQQIEEEEKNNTCIITSI